MQSIHDAVTSVKSYAGYGENGNTESSTTAPTDSLGAHSGVTGTTDNTDSTAETGGTTTQASDSGTTDRTADSTTNAETSGTTGTTDTTTGTTGSLPDRTADTTGSTTDITDTTGTTDSTTDRATNTTATDSEPTTTESAPKPKQDNADTSRSDVQDASQGSDPNLVGPGETGTGKVKMTGTGAPGSHSALFGLTPDGHKETESSSVTTAPQPSEEDAKTQSKEAEGQDTGSRAPGGNEKIAEQLDHPRVAEKGHEGKAVEDEGVGKPGSGI